MSLPAGTGTAVVGLGVIGLVGVLADVGLLVALARGLPWTHPVYLLGYLGGGWEQALAGGAWLGGVLAWVHPFRPTRTLVILLTGALVGAVLAGVGILPLMVWEIPAFGGPAPLSFVLQASQGGLVPGLLGAGLGSLVGAALRVAVRTRQIGPP